MNLSAALYSAQTFGAQYACESPRPKGKSREKTAPRTPSRAKGPRETAVTRTATARYLAHRPATTRRATRTRRVAPTRADAVREEVCGDRGGGVHVNVLEVDEDGEDARARRGGAARWRRARTATRARRRAVVLKVHVVDHQKTGAEDDEEEEERAGGDAGTSGAREGRSPVGEVIHSAPSARRASETMTVQRMNSVVAGVSYGSAWRVSMPGSARGARNARPRANQAKRGRVIQRPTGGGVEVPSRGGVET